MSSFLFSWIVAGFITTRRRANVLKFMFNELSEELLREMPQDFDGRTGLAEFQEYMLVKIGYVDRLIVVITNSYANPNSNPNPLLSTGRFL